MMVSDAKLKELVDLLMRDEHAKAAKAAKVAVKHKRANSTDPWYLACQAYNRQQTCTHQKGTRANGQPIGDRRPTRIPDYNVAKHTFIDRSTKIWCMCGCGWHVWNNPDYSFKWQVGMDMVNHSTNRPSSGQRVWPLTPNEKGY